MSRAAIAFVLMAAVWPGCTCGGQDTVSGSTATTEPLTLSEVQPPEAGAEGGPFATVLGSGFDPHVAVEVRFGDRLSPRTAVIGDDRLQVEIPPGTAGATVDLLVVQGDRSATLAGAFRYRETEPGGDGDH